MFAGLLSTQFNANKGLNSTDDLSQNTQNNDFDAFRDAQEAAPKPDIAAPRTLNNAAQTTAPKPALASTQKASSSIQKQKSLQLDQVAGVQSVQKMSGSMKFTKMDMHVNNYGGKLEWAGNYQRNIKQFVIERSLDDEQYEQVGELAGEGEGEFKKELRYAFEDSSLMHVQMPRIYYRIKQVGTNGDFSYSDVVEHDFGLPVGLYASVDINSEQQAIIQYAADKTGPVKYKILDAVGNAVQQGELNADFTPQTLVLNINSWEKGVYYLNIDDEAHSLTQIFEFE